MNDTIDEILIQEFGKKEKRFLQECIHCGLCLPTCPTYISNGKEMDSPRGRLYLINSVLNGKASIDNIFEKHIKSCLVCRACETACPSGVEFGHLMETTRAALNNAKNPSIVQRLLLKIVIPSHSFLTIIFFLTRFIQRIHLDKLLHVPPFKFLTSSKLKELQQSLPSIPKNRFGNSKSQYYQATDKCKGTVALFTGCIMDHLFPHVHSATVRILNWNGYNVIIPSNQTCCGALHTHTGDNSSANKLAKKNNEILLNNEFDYIAINSAGCGSHLKSYIKYNNSGLASKIMDISELLTLATLKSPKSCPIGPVAYDEPCHLLHGQGISSEPKSILNSIPDINLINLKNADHCCGSAGSYSLSETEMSIKLLEKKMETIKNSGASVVVTANPGCQIQLNWGVKRAKLKIEVLHLVELLDKCYRTDPNYSKI
mgnify:CR=1 FL=1|tara:strand:- start:37018 stop:38304 length:1287 start_codon:yes stop_codon:yes gene_type:complete